VPRKLFQIADCVEQLLLMVAVENCWCEVEFYEPLMSSSVVPFVNCISEFISRLVNHCNILSSTSLVFLYLGNLVGVTTAIKYTAMILDLARRFNSRQQDSTVCQSESGRLASGHGCEVEDGQ
jgi:hypothetical protein